jgi:hypothetical protein
MVIGTITMVERGATPGLSAKWHNEAAKEGWQHTARYWHVTLRDKHFTEAGAREYGYTKRKGEGMVRGSKAYKRSYTGRKEARFGHTRPLEFSGKSRRLTGTARISGTAKGATVRMNAPALNFKHPKSQIVMRDELTRISQPETSELSNVFGQHYHRHANRSTLTKTITIK